MSPLIDQAVEFLAERVKAREAKTALARRVYFRAILLGESPPGGAQTLADAVEHLNLSRGDLSNDAWCFETRQASHAGLTALEQKTREMVAAAREESPQWEHGAQPPYGRTEWGPNVLAAEQHLSRVRGEEDRLRTRAEQARRRAPRVFSPEARKCVESPIEPAKGVESPPQAGEPDPDIEMTGQEAFEDFAEDSVESQPDLMASESTNPNPPVPEPQVTQLHPAPPPAQFAW